MRKYYLTMSTKIKTDLKVNAETKEAAISKALEYFSGDMREKGLDFDDIDHIYVDADDIPYMHDKYKEINPEENVEEENNMED